MSKLIPLHGKHGAGQFAVVDDGMYEVLNMVGWRLSAGGYPCRRGPDGKYILMHRVIAGAGLSDIVDHIDGNKQNNTSVNLRLGDKSINALNMKNKRRRGEHSSRFRGVSWNKKERVWTAYIKIYGRHKYLGGFKDEEVAASAYQEANEKHLQSIYG